MFCSDPISIYRRGVAAGMDPATGLPKRQTVACGVCDSCLASRKNDWTGRLIAEGLTAKSVYFVTLTYANEPEGFPYRDVQLMLKSLRKAASKARVPFGVRFFCVGERGNLRGRAHWHLLLFLDQKVKMARPRMRQLWRFWPHGWTNIQRVEPDDMARSIRYVTKYAVKGIGDREKSCRLRASTKPMLGAAYFDDLAERLAQAGLPAKGWYNLPGIVYTRGRRTGEHVKFRLTHATARRFARQYCLAWDAAYPWKPGGARPYLFTTWLQRWGPIAVTDPSLPKFDWACAPRPIVEGTWSCDPPSPPAVSKTDAQADADRARYIRTQAEQRCEYLRNRFGDTDEVEDVCRQIRWDAEETIADSSYPERWLTLGDLGEVSKPEGACYAPCGFREPPAGGFSGDADPLETWRKIDVAANVKQVQEYLASVDAAGAGRRRYRRERTPWRGEPC